MKRIEIAKKGAFEALLLLSLGLWLGILANGSRIVQLHEPWLDERVALERAEAVRVGELFDATGGWFQPPAYSYLLAALGASTSETGLSPWAPWRLAQVGAWFGILIGLWVLGRRTVGPRVGLLAPLFFALSAESWFMALRPLPEIWLGLAGTLCLLSTETPRVAGLIAGVAAVFRGTAFALAVGPALRRPKSLLFAAAPLVVLSLIHSAHWGALTGPSLNAGINLYIGNGPAANGLYRTQGAYDFVGDPTGAEWLETLAADRAMNAHERDARWRSLALAEMLRNPARTTALFLRKVHLQLAAISIPQIDDFAAWQEQLPWLRVLCLPYGLLSALAVVGWITRGRPTRDDALRWTFVGLLVSTALFFVVGRFRLVLYPYLCVLAATGVHALIHARGRALWRAGAAVALATLVVWPWGLDAETKSLRENARTTLAGRFERRAREQYSARDHETLLATLDRWHSLESAASLDESSATIRLKLLGDLGRAEEAVAYGSSLVARHPDNPVIVLGLGSALARTGRFEEAERLLAAASERWPENTGVAELLGRVREARN